MSSTPSTEPIIQEPVSVLTFNSMIIFAIVFMTFIVIAPILTRKYKK